MGNGPYQAGFLELSTQDRILVYINLSVGLRKVRDIATTLIVDV